MRWHLHEGGYSKLNFDRIETGVKDGFEVWNEPQCSDFAFDYGGLTNDTNVGYVQGGVNANIVTFREGSWSHQSGILALTSVTYAPSDGEIVDADMELNGKDYTFTVVREGGSIDLHNTVAHEAGHALGLDHSAVQTSTMFATAPEGEVSKRDLDTDDVLGLCDSYGNGLNLRCSGGASGYFDAGAAPPPAASDEGSCSTISPSGMLPLGLVMLLLLGMARRPQRRETSPARERRTRGGWLAFWGLVALSASALPQEVQAFERTMTCTSSGANACEAGEVPQPVFWPVGCVTYHINQVGTDDTDNERAFDALEASFATWNEPDCSYLTLINGGFTTEDRVGYNPYTGPEGNANVLVFRNTTWEHGAGIVALTSVTYSPANGEIADADIEFNGEDYRFTTTDDPRRVLIDIANTTTHEAGHFLGLDHSAVPEATMFATAPSGETDKRSLHQDDIDGLCAIYPKQQDPGSNACLGAAPGFFDRPELGPNDGPPPAQALGSCACATPQPARLGVLGALLVLGLLGTTLRRT